MTARPAMSDNLSGALLMIGAMAGFTINDALMKLVSAEVPLFQALLLRGLGVSALLAVLAWRAGVLRPRLQRGDAWLVGLRTLAEAAAAFFFLTALFNMPLANVTAILQALPLTVTLAGALFLREPVGRWRLGAVVVGLAGVMLIVRPGAEGFTVHSLFALIAVLCVTAREILTRRLSGTVPSMAVALWAAVGVTLFAAAGTLTEDWVRPSPPVMLYLLGTVGFIFMAYVLGVRAVRVGDLGFVAPFRYTGLLWALLLGLMLFGDWPDALTLLGAAIVVATGLFTLYREHRLRRRAATAASPRADAPRTG